MSTLPAAVLPNIGSENNPDREKVFSLYEETAGTILLSQKLSPMRKETQKIPKKI